MGELLERRCAAPLKTAMAQDEQFCGLQAPNALHPYSEDLAHSTKHRSDHFLPDGVQSDYHRHSGYHRQN
jgi:hypothetical protein